jgi:hypothetical protein
MALSEALDGFDFNELDAYVGVSAGGFIAAGLANGLSPAYLYRMFIDSDSAEVPFEPEMLLKPAIGEYARRAARFRRCCSNPCASICAAPCSRDFLASFQRLSRAIPTGVFDNAGIDDFLTRLFSLPGLSNDFRRIRKPLFLVATDLDSGTSVAFGGEGLRPCADRHRGPGQRGAAGLVSAGRDRRPLVCRWRAEEDAACVRCAQGRRAAGALHQPAGALRCEACIA